MSVDWKRWEADLLARAQLIEHEGEVLVEDHARQQLEIKRKWQRSTPRPMLWWEWCIWIGWAAFLVGITCFELFH